MKPFTLEEDALLRRQYGRIAIRRIAMALHRRMQKIDERAAALGLSRERQARNHIHSPAPRVKIRASAPLPVIESFFIRQPTLAQLMAGR